MLIWLLIALVSPMQLLSWTWLHTKRFAPKELSHIQHKDHVSFVNINTPHFTQLILSWNAAPLETGYLSFYVQARSRKTKKWLEFHHMMDWGMGIAQSYDRQGSKSQGCHVRLEIPSYADGYRVKIKARNGADISALRALFINIADMKKFTEPYPEIKEQLPSIVVDAVPQYSQMVLDHPRAIHMCSPTSLSMLLGFVFQQTINPLDIAQGVYDIGLGTYGSWPFNAAFAYAISYKQFQETNVPHWAVTRLASFQELHAHLSRGIPLMVSVRGCIPGAAKPYPSGHLLVPIGYDARENKVICHDPAFESADKVKTAYDLDAFLTAWGRSRNLAIVMVPAKA